MSTDWAMTRIIQPERHVMRTRPLLLLAAAAIALAGCASNGAVRQTTTPTPSAAPTTGASAPVSAPAEPAIPQRAHVGDTFTISYDGGGKVRYDITLRHLRQHATPADEFSGAPAGKHLAAAEFIITGLSGHDSDDAANDATVQGSNGQTYETAFDSLALGTDFNSGEFIVRPGRQQTGWLSFEVPDGVRVASVDWNPSSGFGGNPATWYVRR